ncbi:ATP-dependent DNA ligase, partial [Escherichia coli]|nr:ATP-dependent DNA ligase [Escherichia coli]
MQTLDEYRAKRDFGKTGEPSGKGRARKSKGPGGVFVVQKHAASRLHYDFRLEHDGVLWSWAVARGPSLDPADKRLAVHVEDHPLDYAGFEGVIPKGQYGAGEVIVWDDGVWAPAEGYDPADMMAKGDMKFTLKGSKLNGGWHLIRLKPKPGEKADNWLLFKNKDEFARPGEDILEEAPQSVLSGLTIEDIKAGRAAAEPKKPTRKKTAVKRSAAAMPGFIEPCLATLQAHPPSGPEWLHEVKLDGYRIQAHLAGGKATLFTRTGLDWTPKFGDQIAAALEGLPVDDAILDGEIAVLDARGATSFSALQQALSDKAGERLTYFLFDLLWLNGEDLRSEPLSARKQRLQDVLSDQSAPLQYSEHFTQAGQTVFAHVCRLGMEGIVSKRADAPYASGRVHDWLKAKCVMRSEFVVAGYLPSEKTGRGLRS